ncbi:MAG: hypothetical protein ACRC1H_07260, partial [Caldilineaceae bacterium]
MQAILVNLRAALAAANPGPAALPPGWTLEGGLYVYNLVTYTVRELPVCCYMATMEFYLGGMQLRQVVEVQNLRLTVGETAQAFAARLQDGVIRVAEARATPQGRDLPEITDKEAVRILTDALHLDPQYTAVLQPMLPQIYSMPERTVLKVAALVEKVFLEVQQSALTGSLAKLAVQGVAPAPAAKAAAAGSSKPVEEVRLHNKPTRKQLEALLGNVHPSGKQRLAEMLAEQGVVAGGGQLQQQQQLQPYAAGAANLGWQPSPGDYYGAAAGGLRQYQHQQQQQQGPGPQHQRPPQGGQGRPGVNPCQCSEPRHGPNDICYLANLDLAPPWYQGPRYGSRDYPKYLASVEAARAQAAGRGSGGRGRGGGRQQQQFPAMCARLEQVPEEGVVAAAGGVRRSPRQVGFEGLPAPAGAGSGSSSRAAPPRSSPPRLAQEGQLEMLVTADWGRDQDIYPELAEERACEPGQQRAAAL